MKLSNSDLQRILFSLNQLTSDHDPSSLPERTIDSVKSLVATDVVSFEGFGTDNNYEGPLWFVPVANVTNAMLTSMCEYVSDHPCFDGVAAHKLKIRSESAIICRWRNSGRQRFITSFFGNSARIANWSEVCTSRMN